MPLLRRRRRITHTQKNHDAVRLAKRNPPTLPNTQRGGLRLR
jgi:hypothetical protein